jgi:hypothetical protein
MSRRTYVKPSHEAAGEYSISYYRLYSSTYSFVLDE